MPSMTNLREIMTTDVISVRTSSTIENAAELLIQHGISGLPVTDDEGHVKGIVTDYSLLAMLFNPSIRSASVSTIMTTPVITVSVTDSPQSVAELLVRRNIRRVPVLEEGKMVGVISRGNLIRGARLRDYEMLASVFSSQSQPMLSTSENSNILIVDDSAVIHEIVRDALKPTAYRLSFAFSGEEALETMQASPPDLVLLDSIMPGIDGREVLNRHFIKGGLERTPVIMVTSCDRPSHIAEALNAGAIDYLVKPFSAVELQARIASALRTRQYQQQLFLAHKEAEEKTRIRSAFLANMSHEIRTPLTAILGFTELLRDNQSDPENQDSIDRIFRNSRHLLDVINDILDLSKIEAGMLQVNKAPCDPQEIVEDVIDLLQVEARQKGLTLTACIEGKIPECILSDALRIRQILFNIIGNALKFTSSGEVKVTTRLLWNDSTNSSLIEFAISDTGVGMSPQEIKKIFQPYEQANESVAEKSGGTGLGLAISKKIATHLNGDIIAESNDGSGTTFYTTVETGPLDGVRLIDQSTNRRANTLKSGNKAKPPQQMLRGCTILVAEDSMDNQCLLKHVLGKAGALVSVVGNGKEALELALAQAEEASPFDIILMDMQMPVMDGPEAVQRLREKGYQGLIIALTANSSKEARAVSREIGCDAYQSKPFERQTLLQAICDAWNKETSPDSNPNTNKFGLADIEREKLMQNSGK